MPLPPGELDSGSVPAIVSAFEEVYRRLYERLSQAVPLEIINWRVISSSPQPEIRLQVAVEEHTATQSARKGSRKAYFPELGGYHDVPVYSRYSLPPGTSITGPAIVEERESTMIVGPESHCSIDEQWNLVVVLEPDLSV